MKSWLNRQSLQLKLNELTKENQAYQSKYLHLKERSKQDQLVINNLRSKIDEMNQTLENQEKEFQVDMQLIEKLHHKNHCKDAQINELNQTVSEMESHQLKLQKHIEVNKAVYEGKIGSYLEKIKSDKETIKKLIIERDEFAAKLDAESQRNRMLVNSLSKHKESLKRSNASVVELERELEGLFSVSKYKSEKRQILDGHQTDFYDFIDQKLRQQDDLLYETADDYN